MIRPPRIALLTPGWPGQNTPNGIATSVYFLAMGLQKSGRAPVILARDIDGPCPPGIPVIRVPALRWRLTDKVRARFGDPTAEGHRQTARNIAAAVQQAVQEHDVGVVIMEETNGWSAMLQEIVPIPVVLTLHGPWALLKTHASLGADADRMREQRENHGYRTSAGLIAPSQNVMAAVEDASSLDEKPKIVLHNSLDAPVPEKLAAEVEPRDILFVGRVDYLKGADVVVDAFRLLSETHPGARLTFVGQDDGVRRPDGQVVHMENMLAALPHVLRQNISYRGRLDRAEVARLRGTHAIALIASRYENLNYSLLEAMAAGQAIVCTEVGGPAEVLNDAHTALLVPPGNPEAMAAALARLLRDAALTRQLGATARTALSRDFDPETIAAQTARFVDSALGVSNDG